MTFWDSLVEEAGVLRVRQILFVLFMVCVAVRVSASAYARRLRVPLGAIFVYLVLLPVAAYLHVTKSSVLNDTRLLALCLGTLGALGALGALVFGILETRLRVTMPRIVSDLIMVFVSVIATGILATRMGVNLSSLLATSAVVTAVIGLALQDTLGNMVAGITLQLDSSVRQGDWVKIGDVSGRISEIRWRYTAIETRNWETVIVPNAQLVKGQVTVLGRRAGEAPRWRRWVHFNVDFRFAPNQVIEAVHEALRREPIPNVAAEPVTNCVLLEICDSYYRFAVRYWLVDFSVDDPTDSVVRTRVVNALKRMSVPLSIPARAIFVTTDTQERREQKTQRDIQERVAWLRRVSLFNGLSASEAEKLAIGLQVVPFAAREVLTRQGAEAHWLYIVISGSVSVRVHQGEIEREVAQLGEGQFFGEMGLLTGEVRTATVVAISDVECFRLGKAEFHELVQARPEIAEEVARELARRRTELMVARDDLDAAAQRDHEQTTATDLLRKMRVFFGLT
jgi:small-conductance mechanosensitive channel/CRP-like cAMP-binding protein